MIDTNRNLNDALADIGRASEEIKDILKKYEVRATTGIGGNVMLQAEYYNTLHNELTQAYGWLEEEES